MYVNTLRCDRIKFLGIGGSNSVYQHVNVGNDVLDLNFVLPGITFELDVTGEVLGEGKRSDRNKGKSDRKKFILEFGRRERES